MKYCDCHTHTEFSFDADFSVEKMAEGAIANGVQEICFTDHTDFDRPAPDFNIPDFPARAKHIEEARRKYPQLRILCGAEVSLADMACADRAREVLSDLQFDQFIGSLHTVKRGNVWEAAFFDGHTKQEMYRYYLEQLREALDTFPELDVMGHYDFVAHYAPYEDRSMHYSDAPEVFDSIFRWLVEHGKTMEINTSSWEGGQPWGVDILSRFRELGGRFVTIGSDAHNPGRPGERFADAVRLAGEAGLAVAVYHNHRPVIL